MRIRTACFGGVIFLQLLGMVPAALAQAQSEAAPPDLQQFYREFTQAYADKQWERACTLGEQCVKLIPQDNQRGLTLMQYNLCCVHALAGHREVALDWLEKSVKNGFVDVVHMKKDSDLDSLRKEERYKKTIEYAEQLYKGDLGVAEKKTVIHVPKNVDASQAVPLLVAMHGRGAGAQDMVNAWQQAADKLGVIVVAPQGLQRLGPDSYAWREVDECDKLVMEAVTKARSGHRIDKSRIVLTGFSQGGYMAYEIALRHPDVFCGLIPVAGMWKPGPDTDPAKAGKAQMSIFIMVGGDDYAPVITSNAEAAELLAEEGMRVHHEVYQGVGHTFPDDCLTEKVRALRFVWGEEHATE